MKNILALLFALSFFSSCKKDKNESQVEIPEYPSVPKVKTIITGAGTVQTYTYDELGRQKTWQINSSFKTEHIYEVDRILKIHSNPSTGSIIGRDTLQLNNKGLVSTETNYLDPDFITKYEYNNDRYVTSVKEIYIGTLASEEKYYYANNRLDSFVYFNPSSRYYVYKYTNYDLTKNHSLTNYNYGQYYYGRQSPNPHLKFEFFQVIPNQTTQTNIYTYLYDVNGRVIKETSNSTHPGGGTSSSSADIAYY
jgi:YD repeat-containing protein